MKSGVLKQDVIKMAEAEDLDITVILQKHLPVTQGLQETNGKQRNVMFVF